MRCAFSLGTAFGAALIFLGFSSLPAIAKDKHRKTNSAQDEIRVLSHVALTAGPVDKLLLTTHYSRNYLYVEYESSAAVTLVDVTKGDSPAVISHVPLTASGGAASLLAVAGNASLVGSGTADPKTLDPQTIRILSFVDPAHPSVQQEFSNVSSMIRDDRRGLIFLAASDGLWILQERFAEDPVAEAQWEHDHLDAR